MGTGKSFSFSSTQHYCQAWLHFFQINGHIPYIFLIFWDLKLKILIIMYNCIVVQKIKVVTNWFCVDRCSIHTEMKIYSRILSYSIFFSPGPGSGVQGTTSRFYMRIMFYCSHVIYCCVYSKYNTCDCENIYNAIRKEKGTEEIKLLIQFIWYPLLN